MRVSYLTFVSSRILFCDLHGPESWEFTDPRRWADMVTGNYTVVRTFTTDKPLKGSERTLFGREPVPSWVEMTEIIEIGTNFACAPDDFYADEDDNEGGYLDDYPASFNLRNGIEYDGVSERPSFGRRLLLVWYFDEHTTVNEKHKARLRRHLGMSARPVWFSYDMVAFAFTDNRTPEAIGAGLGKLFDYENVEDWMICEIVSLAVPDRSGASPLSVWLKHPENTDVSRMIRRKG